MSPRPASSLTLSAARALLGVAPGAGDRELRAAYREVFATLKVDLGFTIQETEVSGDMAWLRATSSGRIRILATGMESAEAFNLVVVFRREAGAWKIRNYIYASSRPGTGPAK